MPIIIGDYKWTQTLNEILLRIPFKNVNLNLSNIFTHDSYIKVNCPPHYFEMFLMYPINVEQSRCKINEVEIKFTLIKKNAMIWESLEKHVNLRERTVKKEIIVKEVQEDITIKSQAKKEAKSKLQRKFVSKEVERDTGIRDQIDQSRQKARKTELQKIEGKRLLLEIPLLADPSISANTLLQQQPIEPYKMISSRPSPQHSNIPTIRKTGCIEVAFSERKFPTPLRDSQQPAENEWLLKMHAARKTIGFVEEDLRPEERNPQWLTEKGNEFFKNSNYLAAISAYSTAIKLNSKCYDALLNRSACHWSLGNYNKCIADCSDAYELLTPHIAANQHLRARCLARRAAALCKIGYLKQGHDEICEALKLDPKNELLQQDAIIIKNKLEESDDSH